MTQPLLPDFGGLSAGADEPARPTPEGFRIVRWLGSGSAAHVWLVADEQTGTEYALKLPLRPEDAAGPADATAGETERERLLLESAPHEHLLAAVRVVKTGEGAGLLLQYAAGGSVAALVAARGPLSVSETVTVLTPIAQALAFLHASGVTHGDVSPGNVLFTEHGKPLLSDFGIARIVGSARTALGGTPGFIAPEAERAPAAGNNPEPDGDVYALAALGWYMLTGRVPARTAKRPPLAVMVPDVPLPLVELLEAGLADSPGERPSAGEFGRRAYRTANAEPVDLAAAAHPSVAPKLLTRRVARGRDGRAVLPSRLRRGAAGRPPGRRGAAEGRARYKRPAAGEPGPAAGPKRYRAVVTAAALAAGVALAILAGSAIAGAGPRVPSAGMAQPSSSWSAAEKAEEPALPEEFAKAIRGDKPDAAVEALTWLRSEALRSLDAGLLDQVNADESPAMAADREIIAAMEERDHRFIGLSVQVSEAAVVDRAAGKAQVTATVTTSAFEQRDAGGRVVATADKPKVQDLLLVLVREQGRWLIQAVHHPPR